MDKLKYIKFEESQGQYTNSIPIGVDSKNVDLKTGYNLEQTLGDYDLNKGTIEDRLLESAKIDKTLTKQNFAAQSKTTGEEIGALKKKKITTYKTIDEMVNDISLTVEMIVQVFEQENNNITTYQIVQTKPDTYFQTLNNGLFAKIINDEKVYIKANSVSPVYIGDYLSNINYVPSSCIKIENFFYTFDAPANDYAIANKTNTGKVRRFNLTENIEDIDWCKEIKTAHANSAAYNKANAKIYIVPIWDYETTSDRVNAKFLYEYSLDFSSYKKINIPSVAMGVSYDSKKNKLYYYDYDHKIYLYENNEFIFYTEIDFTNIQENQFISRTYNQDFAVYNGTFFISSPYRNIIYGTIKKDQTRIEGSLYCNNIDSFNIFRFGELEGFEFDEKGYLYSINIITLSSQIRNAFITEIPIGFLPQNSTSLSGNLFTLTDGTLTLSEETTKKFRLATHEIRSLHQLLNKEYIGGSVQIPINNNIEETGQIRIIDDIEIKLLGSLTCGSIDILKGSLNLNASAEDALLILNKESNLIRVNRQSMLTLSGRFPLRISIPNAPTAEKVSFIQIDYALPVIKIRQMPIEINGKTLYIGQKKITAAGLYIGSRNYFSPNDADIQYPSLTNFFGHVTGNSKQIRFSIPQNVVPFSNTSRLTTILSGQVTLRGIQGYLVGNSLSAATIDLQNIDTDLIENVEISGGGTNFLNILITFKEPIFNAINNTPVVITTYGTMILHID